MFCDFVVAFFVVSLVLLFLLLCLLWLPWPALQLFHKTLPNSFGPTVNVCCCCCWRFVAVSVAVAVAGSAAVELFDDCALQSIIPCTNAAQRVAGIAANPF